MNEWKEVKGRDERRDKENKDKKTRTNRINKQGLSIAACYYANEPYANEPPPFIHSFDYHPFRSIKLWLHVPFTLH